MSYGLAMHCRSNWPHDQARAAWSPGTVRKLNVDKRPVNLSLADLPKVNHAGPDAVWQHGADYTVTEAKARESIAAAYELGRFLAGKGKLPEVAGLNPDQQLLHYLLSDSEDKREWTDTDIDKVVDIRRLLGVRRQRSNQEC